MSRIVLIHWDPAEARERAGRLRDAGHTVRVQSKGTGAEELRTIRSRPPDLFVVDLGRSPSQGRDVGVWLRQQKDTRDVPIVFVGGDATKVARVRELLPDAEYASWRGIRGAIGRATRGGVARPVVPSTMAGYSGTPLPKKLGILPGRTVALIGAPATFQLGELPEGVRPSKRAGGARDVVLLFTRSVADLARRFASAARTVADGGRLWIVWPKKSSTLASDLGGNEVRAFGMDAGWVDYKIAALDEDWSGLCFSRRSAKPPIKRASKPAARRRKGRAG